MQRREFIVLLGGTVAWPLTARSQQPERMRRIGVLMSFAADDPEGQTRMTAFLQELQQLGWTDGRNVRIDVRWGVGDSERYRRYATELLALAPDIILAFTSPIVAALQRTTRTVPIVFVGVIDPVGAGFVTSLARPGGNTTGFTAFEYAISAKWLELIKEMVPGVTRVAVLRDANIAAGIGQFAAIQAVGPIGIELSVIGQNDAKSIEESVAAFARSPNGALIVTAGPFAANHPDLIAKLAAQHKLPAIYPFRYFVNAGGLFSYGPNTVSQFRPASGYVDRILRGAKAAELPVQVPVKFELVVNLKTAKALGLTVPPSILLRADEVIE
jgi:putative tryptophan/tyrosine transport system substrate-binding protein